MNWNDFNNRVSHAILKTNRLEDLLAALGCDLRKWSERTSYRGGCPVHGGNGKNFLLRKDGDILPINWKCYSRHCEDIYKPSLLGLVRGVLTFRKCGGWVTDLRQAIDLQEAVTFLETFMAGLSEDYFPVTPKVDRSIPSGNLLSLSREQVRQRLVIPAPYFVMQGFSPAVLNGFDVGHSAKRRRSIVPLYDDRGEVCIGYLARSEKPYCPKCKKCHESRSDCRYGQKRWSFPTNFPKSTYLFNYHNVLRSPSPSVLLVEGPGDVFKAVEVGVTVVAPLGSELAEEQAAKLVALGKEVIVALDNDETGKRQAWVVYQGLRERGLRTTIWHPPEKYKDVGAMPAEEVVAWMARRRRHEEELDAVLGPSG